MKYVLIVGLSAFAVGQPHAASAGEVSKTTATTSGGIAEIVVTAQRRSEDVQKTPLSIEAIPGEALRAAGVDRPDDLVRVSPGLQVSGGTTTQIYVRGVGDFGVTATANPAVVTSLDGVVIDRPQAISGNFFDLDRIELLKGPQGALYGRNASGGALNLLTAAPKLGEFSGYAEGTVGNYGELGSEGALNLPTGSAGALRFSYQLNSRNGYLSNGTDDDKHESVRLQGKFEPSDKLTIRGLITYAHLGGKGDGLAPIPKLAGQSAWTGDTTALASDAYIQAATENFIHSGGKSPPPFLIANPKTSTLFQDVRSSAVQAEVDYDADFATLTVIPAYRRTDSRFAHQPSFLYNVGGAYNGEGDRTGGETSDQSSLEVRLSKTLDKLDWVLGGYLLDEQQSTDYALQSGPILNTRPSMDLGARTYAVFGQGSYRVMDRLRVTAGLRYTSDQRQATNFALYAISPMVLGEAPSPADCTPNNGHAPGSLCPLVNTRPGYYDSQVTFDRVTWKAGLEYDLAARSMVWADISTGFKAGGFNQAVSLANPSQLQPFNPEEVTAYTVGVKNRFFDNRLQFNVEGFYYDYRNLQLSAAGIDGVGAIVLLTRNAGKARIDGGAFNAQAQVWTGGTVRGSLELLDTRYDQFLIQQPAMFVPPGRVACPVSAPNAKGLVTVDCSGRSLIRAPKTAGNFAFSQIVPLQIPGELGLDADVDFAGSRYLATDFTPSELAAGYAEVSASVTYTAPSRRWFVSAWGRNLGNAEIYTGGGGHQSPFVTGWVTSSIAPPRTYGARFGVKF